MLDALGAVTLECAWMRLEAPGIGMGADCGRGGMTHARRNSLTALCVINLQAART